MSNLQELDVKDTDPRVVFKEDKILCLVFMNVSKNFALWTLKNIEEGQNLILRKSETKEALLVQNKRINIVSVGLHVKKYNVDFLFQYNHDLPFSFQANQQVNQKIMQGSSPAQKMKNFFKGVIGL